MAKEEGKTVTVKSSDGEVFEGDEAVAKESQTISHMIEDGCADSDIRAKVIEYCNKHVDAQKSGEDKIQEEEFEAWDVELVKLVCDSFDLDRDLAMMVASNDLDRDLAMIVASN